MRDEQSGLTWELKTADGGINDRRWTYTPYDGNPATISEADALIAYLQMLGTQVNFKLYDNKANIR